MPSNSSTLQNYAVYLTKPSKLCRLSLQTLKTMPSYSSNLQNYAVYLFKPSKLCRLTHQTFKTMPTHASPIFQLIQVMVQTPMIIDGLRLGPSPHQPAHKRHIVAKIKLTIDFED